MLREDRIDQRTKEDAMKFHVVMKLLKRSRMEHGTCQPRSRNACTACHAKEELEKMLAAYRGAPVVLQ